MPDSSFASSPFLPAAAEDLLQNGQFNTNVEVVLGSTKDEGLGNAIGAWIDPEWYQITQNTFDTTVTAFLLGLMRESDVTEDDIAKAHQLLNFYVGGEENITETNVQGIVDMLTDSFMLYGVQKTIGYLQMHGMTVFQYILTHRGEYSVTQAYTPETVTRPPSPPCPGSTGSPMPTTSSMSGSPCSARPGTQRPTNFPEK